MKQLLLIFTLLIFVYSCKSDKPKDDTATTDEQGMVDNVDTPDQDQMEASDTEVEVENAYADPEYMANAEKQLRNMDKFKGKDIKVFQGYNTYGDGRINISLQDPDKPENIDEYNYEKGKWLEPQPMQISGDGDMSANVFSLSKAPFSSLPIAYKLWNEKANSLEDKVTNTCDFIAVQLWVPTQELRMITSTMQTDRSTYNFVANLDGTMKSFEKN